MGAYIFVPYYKQPFMMKSTIILVFTFAFLFQSFGQETTTKNVLMFIGRIDGNTIILEEGKRFTAYWKNDQNEIKHTTGRLQILNQSFIQVGKETIRVEDLTTARVHVVGKKVAGGILDLAGFGLIAIGANVSSNNIGDLEGGAFKGIPYFIAGVAIIAISTPVLIIIPRTYNLTTAYRPVVREIAI